MSATDEYTLSGEDEYLDEVEDVATETPVPGGGDATDPGDDTSDTSEGPASVADSGGTSSRRGLTRAQVKRVVSKVEAYTAAEADVRNLAAHLLGCEADVAALTVATMAGTKQSSQVLSDLAAIRDMDAMRAGAWTFALPSSRLVSLWKLLAALDAVPKARPSVAMNAALEAASAIGELTDVQMRRLEEAAALTKKS